MSLLFSPPQNLWNHVKWILTENSCRWVQRWPPEEWAGLQLQLWVFTWKAHCACGLRRSRKKSSHNMRTQIVAVYLECNVKETGEPRLRITSQDQLQWGLWTELRSSSLIAQKSRGHSTLENRGPGVLSIGVHCLRILLELGLSSI